jgi:hypothetical protein
MRVYELATYQQLKLILENETALVVVYVGSDNFPQGAAQYEYVYRLDSTIINFAYTTPLQDIQ